MLSIFEAQLRAGRPLTITHPEATRYFMSCEEAALLVIDAGSGEYGQGTFILDMGEPVRIQDLAADLIRLRGGDPEAPGTREFIGLLPGEKLHEELASPWERLERVSPYLYRVSAPTPAADVRLALSHLEAAMGTGDEEEVRRELFRQVAVCGAPQGAEAPAARGTRAGA